MTHPTMKAIAAAILFALPATLVAQSGSITYDRTDRYDFDLPPARQEFLKTLPPAKITPMVVTFNGAASIMQPAPTTAAPQKGVKDPVVMGRVARLKMGSANRGDHESILSSYVNLKDGAMLETREFLGRTFQVVGARTDFDWQLTRDVRNHLGFRMQRATALQDSTVIEAWFAPDIPVSNGPGEYGGLPGMILALSVDSGRVVYTATEVKLGPVEKDALNRPATNNTISRADYEKVVAEKLQELKKELANKKGDKR